MIPSKWQSVAKPQDATLTKGKMPVLPSYLCDCELCLKPLYLQYVLVTFRL